MKRLIALVTGVLVATGLTIAPAPPSGADATVGDDWAITVIVPRTSWSRELLPNFTTSPCHELMITVDVAGTAITAATGWSVSVDLRPHGAASATQAFDFPGSGTGSFTVGGIRICDDFKAPDAHPEGLYDVTGEAHVPTSTTPTRPLATTFGVDPLWTYVGMMGYDNLSGASVITGTVFESQSTPEGGIFNRPVAGGTVVLQQLVGGVWTWIANGVWMGNGSFSASAGTILPIGTYLRFVYSGDFSVAGATGFPYQMAAPFAQIPPPIPVVTSPAPVVATQPTARVTIKAVSGRSKLKVDVNPNLGTKYWTFQVQRKNPDGSWKALKTYRTQGPKETRTVNLRKGTYRVWVNPKLWYQGTMSANEVTLKR